MDFNNNVNDTFFEQIIPIRKTGKSVVAIFGIWFLALLLVFLLITVLSNPFSLFLICAVGYGAWWLTSKFNVEYEYIITNGTLDIDKITNKSARKRILSFELKDVTRLEKHNPALLQQLNRKEVVVACDNNDQGAYFMTAEKSGKGKINLVFAPNEKLQSAIERFAPKFITNNAFKN